MRERALSAAVSSRRSWSSRSSAALDRVLLVARVASVRSRSSGSSGSAGYPARRSAPGRLALAVACSTRRRRSTGPGGGRSSSPSASSLAPSGPFARPDPRDGLATWTATVFGALYVGLLGFVVRLGDSAPDLPAVRRSPFVDASGPGSLLLVLSVWAYDTGAYLVGGRFGGDASS